MSQRSEVLPSELDIAVAVSHVPQQPPPAFAQKGLLIFQSSPYEMVQLGYVGAPRRGGQKSRIAFFRENVSALLLKAHVRVADHDLLLKIACPQLQTSLVQVSPAGGFVSLRA